MALTITSVAPPGGVKSPQRIGNDMEVRRQWTLAGTYVNPTGHALTLSQDLPGMTACTSMEEAVFVNGQNSVVSRRATDGTIHFYQGGGAGVPFTEVANAASLAGFVGVVIARGF